MGNTGAYEFLLVFICIAKAIVGVERITIQHTAQLLHLPDLQLCTKSIPCSSTELSGACVDTSFRLIQCLCCIPPLQLKGGSKLTPRYFLLMLVRVPKRLNGFVRIPHRVRYIFKISECRFITITFRQLRGGSGIRHNRDFKSLLK